MSQPTDEDRRDRAAFTRALPAVAVLVAAYSVYSLWQLPRVLDDMGRLPRMSCDELLRNGPGGHRYVIVTDARLSVGKSVSERDGESGALELYHPVYPAALGQEPDLRDLSFILCIMDEGERRRVRDDRNRRAAEGRPGLSEITCEVRKGSERLPNWARAGLAAQYPNIRPGDCWVLTVGEKEPTPAYARHLAWHGGLSGLTALGCFGWWRVRRQAQTAGLLPAAQPA